MRHAISAALLLLVACGGSSPADFEGEYILTWAGPPPVGAGARGRVFESDAGEMILVIGDGFGHSMACDISDDCLACDDIEGSDYSSAMLCTNASGLGGTVTIQADTWDLVLARI